jgi:hypothetical protein
MNAVIKDKENQPVAPPIAIDESNLPISKVSKEERERRRLNCEAAAERASREAKEKGLTEEILEELLKDI